MGENGCYGSFSLTLSTRDGLKTEDSSLELPGEMTLDLLPQRQGRHVQKLMQTCGETLKSFHGSLQLMRSALGASVLDAWISVGTSSGYF